MKTIVPVIFFISIVSCACAQEIKKYARKDLDFHVYNTGQIQFKSGDTIEKYESHIRGVDSILIVRRKDKRQIQVIIPEENEYRYNSDIGNDPLNIEDMNFDGYEDISILESLPSGPNFSYFIWIYDPKKSIFERSAELENLSSPVVDHKNKTIVSDWKASAGSYGTDTYKYINGKLTLIIQETRTSDPNTFDMIKVIKKRVNGQMKIISKTRSKNWD